MVEQSPVAVEGATYAAVVEELQSLNQAHSAVGVAALALARRLDADLDTGAGVAALVKELRATLLEARRHAAPAADVVDDLRRQRERRLHRPQGPA